MHIPDGIIPLNQSLVYMAIAAVFVLIAIWQSKKTLTLKQIPILGVLAAGLFAAQLFNFPVPFGSSGHFIGTALATALVGPWAGILVLTAILIIQSFFGDGGFLALGANVMNMAVIGAFVTVLFFALIPKKFRERKGLYAAFGGLAAFFATVLMALAASTELAIAQLGPPKLIFSWMIGLHAIIGLAEGVITTAIIFFTFKADASLLTVAEDSLFMREQREAETLPPQYKFPVWGLVTTVSVFGLMSIFGIVASSNPDGLERTLENLGIEGIETGIFGFPEGLGWDILQMAIIMAIIFSAILIVSGISYAIRRRKYLKEKEAPDKIAEKVELERETLEAKSASQQQTEES